MNKIVVQDKTDAKITLGYEGGSKKNYSKFYSEGISERFYQYANGDITLFQYDPNKIVWNRIDIPSEYPCTPTPQELAYQAVAAKNAAYVASLPMRD